MAEMNSDENSVLHPMMTSVAANDDPLGMRQRQQVGAEPLDHDGDQDRAAAGDEAGAEQQAGLQLEVPVERGQRPIVPVEAAAPRIGLGVEAEAQDLEPDDAEDRREHRGDAGRRPPAEPHEAQQHREVDQPARGTSRVAPGARKSLFGE